MKAGCNFTKTDIEGKTAVHWTVDNIDGSCLHAIVDRYPHLLNKQYIINISYLIKLSTDRDSNGHTILHLASYRGNVNLVDELLSITGYIIIIPYTHNFIILIELKLIPEIKKIILQCIWQLLQATVE